jgi:hypothetical protein
VMGFDGNDHVTWTGISMSSMEDLQEFGEFYGATFDDQQSVVFEEMRRAWTHYQQRREALASAK